ncbi:lipase 3-like [Leptinotarsa decemlineata]|uniref:lipase 3-like n=1 Tax=Leptinotarsa decemlineata TaxID=7539 RepID=UPI003D309B3E
MIVAAGYQVESHYVTTSDGYILGVHRIPQGRTSERKNETVLFVHGLFCSSSDAILFGPKKSPGYFFADKGYDVWIINVRGNTYSRNHTYLNPDTDAEFWNFSWHEIGTIDVPTVIDYILDVTGTDGVYYIGYSQGSIVFLVMTSIRPDYNAKVKVHIGLAPTVYMNNVRSPLLLTIASWSGILESFLKLFGVNEFLAREGIGGNLIKILCSTNIGASLCESILFSLCGSNPSQLNSSLVPLMMSHAPSGCSTNQVFHFLQLMLKGGFGQLDLGLEGNLEKYGAETPPQYDLSKITTPVYLFHGANDYLAAKADIDTLHEKFSSGVATKVLMEDSMWAHMDFVFGINASEVVYSKITDIFEKH